MTVESLVQLLEEELKSFHRFILLLTENLVKKQRHEEVTNEIRGDLIEVITIMRERFEAVDRRFESVDKRFEDMNKRFTGLQWAMGFSVTILAILMTIYQFI